MKLFQDSTLPLHAQTGIERYILYDLESSSKNLGLWVVLNIFSGGTLLVLGWHARETIVGSILSFLGIVILGGIVRLWKDSVLVRMIRRSSSGKSHDWTEPDASPEPPPRASSLEAHD